jgi:hypothetical protein
LQAAFSIPVPTIVIKGLALLLYILEVPDLKLGPRDQLPWLSFLWISLVIPGKCWDSTLKQAMTVSFHICSSTSYTNHCTIKLNRETNNHHCYLYAHLWNVPWVGIPSYINLCLYRNVCFCCFFSCHWCHLFNIFSLFCMFS